MYAVTNKADHRPKNDNLVLKLPSVVAVRITYRRLVAKNIGWQYLHSLLEQRGYPPRDILLKSSHFLEFSWAFQVKH